MSCKYFFGLELSFYLEIFFYKDVAWTLFSILYEKGHFFFVEFNKNLLYPHLYHKALSGFVFFWTDYFQKAKKNILQECKWCPCDIFDCVDI